MRTLEPSSNPPRSLHRGWWFHARRQVGSWLFLPLIAAAVLSGRHWADGHAMDEFLDASGTLLLIGGLVPRRWATLFIGGNKSGELITAGPYSLCRNPLYLGSLLIGLGFALMLQSLTLGVAIAVLGPLLYLLVVREEERVMAAAHGEAYDHYRAQVPRLFPRRLLPEPSERKLMIDLLAMRRHCVRSLAAILLIPLNETVAMLQSDGSIPRLLGLP